jgi:hypothetical protein
VLAFAVFGFLLALRRRLWAADPAGILLLSESILLVPLSLPIGLTVACAIETGLLTAWSTYFWTKGRNRRGSLALPFYPILMAAPLVTFFPAGYRFESFGLGAALCLCSVVPLIMAEVSARSSNTRSSAPARLGSSNRR